MFENNEVWVILDKAEKFIKEKISEKNIREKLENMYLYKMIYKDHKFTERKINLKDLSSPTDLFLFSLTIISL